MSHLFCRRLENPGKVEEITTGRAYTRTHAFTHTHMQSPQYRLKGKEKTSSRDFFFFFFASQRKRNSFGSRFTLNITELNREQSGWIRKTFT